MNSLTLAFAALFVGAALGAAIAWLLAKSRHSAELATTHERLRSLAQMQEQLRAEHQQDDVLAQQLQSQLISLDRELATVSTRLEEERKQAEEKIALLREVSESGKKALTEEFQNLASTILEDKTRRFTEQNQENLGQLLNPFKERLNEFRTKVEEIHYHDTQQQAAMTCTKVRWVLSLLLPPATHALPACSNV